MVSVIIKTKMFYYCLVIVILYAFPFISLSSDNIDISINSDNIYPHAEPAPSEPFDIKSPATLIAGCEYSYPPFCIVDDNGNADGFSVELLKAASQKAGLEVNFKVDYWDSLKNDLKQGVIQVLPLVGRTPARERVYDFSFPYTTNYGAIFVRKGDNRIGSVSDLIDKEILVMKGDTAEEYARRENISSNIITVETYVQALKLLSQGKYDAVVAQQLMGMNLLKELKIDNVVPVGNLLHGFRQDFCFAVRKGDKKLLSLLNEGLSKVIADGTYDKLYKKWFAEILEHERSFVLTEREKDWIKEHPVIRLGFNPDMEPLLIVEPDGSFSGIYPTIFNEINNRLNLNIQIVIDGWDSTVIKAKKREVDGLLANAPSQSKASNLLRTTAIHSSYPILYARYDSPMTFNSMDDLIGKRVAYHKEVKMLEIRLKEYEDKCQIIPAKSTLESIKLLLEGKVDLVMAISFENYQIAKHAISGVKIVYYDLEHETPVATGIRDDWPELVGIIDKGLELVGPSRIRELVSNWTNIDSSIQKVVLSQNEQNWLADHPDITFGFSSGYEPFLVKKNDGSYSGMLVDLLDIINERLGTDFEVKEINWAKNVELLESGEIDGILAMTPQAARKHDYFKTIPHFSSTPTIFCMDNASFVLNSLDDLKGKKIAYLDNSIYVIDLLEPLQDQVELIPCETVLDAMLEVFKGNADAAVGLSTNNYLINKYSLSGMSPKLILSDTRVDGVTVVRHDYPELVSILNKALSSISEEEYNTIYSKWSVVNPVGVRFTISEKKWLADHSEISVGLPHELPPYSFQRKGKGYNGIFQDYLDIISKHTGLKFKYVYGNWTELVNKAENKEIDFLPAIDVEDSGEHLQFSDKFINYAYVIIVRNDVPLVKNFNWLNGKKVAIGNKSSLYKHYIDKYPEIDFITVDSDAKGLEAVSGGQIDAYICDSVSASYSIINKKLPNLKIVAPADTPVFGICFGVCNDSPEFLNIINKAVQSITEQEHNAILNKWMSVRYEQVTYWHDALKWILSAMAIPVFGLILVLSWNRQLGRAVKSRTEELEIAKKFTEDAINSLQDIFMVFKPSKIEMIPVLWNKSMIEVTGYCNDEVRTNPLPSAYFSKEDTKIAFEAIENAIEHGWATCELDIICKDGSFVSSDFVLTRIDNPDGSLNYLVVVGRDITERKAVQEELDRHRQNLEELVQERTQELNRRNKELVDAMAKLKDTQAQLILFEKLGALKHLVSGIAHEINSPLGAISTSREILLANLKKLTKNISILSNWLEGSHGIIAGNILESCFANSSNGTSLSPREKRQARQNISNQLNNYNIKNADEISQKLIELNIMDNIDFMLPILKENDVLDKLNAVGIIIESTIACDTIEIAVHKASKIVNALNSYIRKGGSGEKDLSMEFVDIKESLDNVLTLFYNAIKYTITLDFECDADIPQIIGDSDELNQVWTNLIKNSLDAMGGSGELKIRVYEQDSGVSVVITDTGCGMNEEVKSRIFEPLFTTKPAGEGTGLGMDIVQKIVVEDHRGKIDIESELNRGTTISVWLPAGHSGG